MKFHPPTICPPLLIAGAIFIASLDAKGDSDPLLTVVKAKHLKQKPLGDHKAISQASAARANPSEVLPELLGITLNRQGGPLAPADIKMRGLGSSRLSVQLEGLELADPGTGLIDANDLPLFATTSMQSNSSAQNTQAFGQLALHLPSAQKPFAISRFGVGSFHTGRTEAIVGAPLCQIGDVVLAMQASTTQGNFTFSPTSIVADVEDDALLTRQNNDQHRVSSLLKANFKLKATRATTLLFGKFHEGGIPGFSMAPTNQLRGRHTYFGGLQEIKVLANPITLDLRYQTRVDNRETWQKAAAHLSSVAYFSNRIEAETHAFLPSSQSHVSLSAHGEILNTLGDNKRRLGAGLGLKANTQFSADSPFFLASALAFTSYDKVGILPTGFVEAAYAPFEFLRLGVKLSRSARMPTFSELYAPQGMVVGNDKLLPESGYDAEIYIDAKWKQLLTLKLAGFVGQMNDTILYVNRNAFEISPINTDEVKRVGLDARLELTPHPLVALEWTAQTLGSKLPQSEAPLPGVPSFSTLVALRLGELNGLCGYLKLNHKGTTSSNLYGTLEAPAYTLFDFLLRLPLNPFLALNFSVTNLFNVTTAQDSNLLPMPGREFFALLELKT